jgi:hypothetical protein
VDIKVNCFDWQYLVILIVIFLTRVSIDLEWILIPTILVCFVLIMGSFVLLVAHFGNTFHHGVSDSPVVCFTLVHEGLDI